MSKQAKVVIDLNKKKFPVSPSLDEKNNEVIVKLVNGSESHLTTKIEIEGKDTLCGTQIILTSDNSLDTNTLRLHTRLYL